MLTVRSISALCLSLLFAVTGVGFGVAKGTAHPVGAFVICRGLSTAVIYVDAQGNEVERVQVCPDAALSLSTGPAIHGTFAVPQRLSRGLRIVAHADFKLPTARRPAPPARAPPLNVV